MSNLHIFTLYMNYCVVRRMIQSILKSLSFCTHLTRASRREIRTFHLPLNFRFFHASTSWVLNQKFLYDFHTIPFQAPDTETLLFMDGRRRIDMVLVYEEEDFGVMTEAEMLKRERRKAFRENLEKEGLEFELEDRKVEFLEFFNQKSFVFWYVVPWSADQDHVHNATHKYWNSTFFNCIHDIYTFFRPHSTKKHSF